MIEGCCSGAMGGRRRGYAAMAVLILIVAHGPPSARCFHSWNYCVCNIADRNHRRVQCSERSNSNRTTIAADPYHGWKHFAFEDTAFVSRYPQVREYSRRFYNSTSEPAIEALRRQHFKRYGSSSLRQHEPFPHVIHQTWKTHDLPAVGRFRNGSESWQAKHPGWEYLLWDDDENRAFLSRHYPWFIPHYDAYDHFIKRVDAVRVFYMYHFGGVYADLDSYCLRPFEPLLEREAATEAEVVLSFVGGNAQANDLGSSGKGDSYSEVVHNAVMASRRHAPFWLDVMDIHACMHAPFWLDVMDMYMLIHACISVFQIRWT